MLKPLSHDVGPVKVRQEEPVAIAAGVYLDRLEASGHAWRKRRFLTWHAGLILSGESAIKSFLSDNGQ